MWIALKEQKVKRGSEYVLIKKGEKIPEAETWPNRDVWVKTGFIRFVTGVEKLKKIKKIKKIKRKLDQENNDEIKKTVYEPRKTKIAFKSKIVDGE